MEAKYRSLDGQFEVSFDEKDPASLFEKIAEFQEVFETGEVKICGKVVPKEHIQFRVRTVDDNKYFEKVYVGPDHELWGFKLPYGQNKKGGGLFPKYRLSDEDKVTNKDGGGGWRKFIGVPTGEQETKSEKKSGDKAPF